MTLNDTGLADTGLAGATALVTGATSGIGRAAAVLLARRGAHVLVSGRDAARGEAVVTDIRSAGGKADFLAADLTDGGSVRALARRAVELGGGHVDILVNNAGVFPIWLGDNSSVTKRVIERLYACSHLLNDAGQYAYYGRVGGCLITGNEDGVKHCAMNVLYSLQHLGYTIPPQADAGWIGEAGPGPSYLDPGSGGPGSDFTNRNTTFMTWNLLHLARMLKDSGGIPAHGNQRSGWDAGCRYDFDNPEYR
jgi:hypothetical protein